jgi:threonylcarbamoyladenosine tRNA methylthiotransferase MtaB
MKDVFGLAGEFRIRFSSLEPGEVTESLAGVLSQGGERFCDYFHLPLQAGSDGVLKAMRRPYTTAGYLKKLALLRERFGDPGLFADIIAGYPSETEEQFGETLAFVEKCRFSGLHVFRFSRRAGTAAAALQPLPASVVAARAAALRKLDTELRARFAGSMTGRTLNTLVLSNKGGTVSGLASNFLRVGFTGTCRPGSLVRVPVTGVLPGGAGEVCSGSYSC